MSATQKYEFSKKIRVFFLKSLMRFFITSDNPWCIYLVINFLIEKLKKKQQIFEKSLFYFLNLNAFV